MNTNLVGRALTGLIVIVILCIAGIVYLTATDRTVPDVLEQTITGAVVGLVALLPGAVKESVRVSNDRDDPIPVEDA